MKAIFILLLLLCTTAAQAQKTLPFVDEKPKYREWSSSFKIESVEYLPDLMVVHFLVVHETIKVGNFYPPSHRQAWLLRDEKGRIYPMLGLKDLRLNGKVHTPFVEKTTVVQDDPNVKRNLLRCKLYFPRLPDDVQQVDLIEGLGMEQYPNAYHAFQLRVYSFPKVPRPRA